MPTVIPFHRTVVDDPAYIGDGSTFGIYTSWIETEFDNQIPPYAGGSDATADAADRTSVTVEVGGRRLEVVLPAGFAAGAAAGPTKKPKREKRKAGAAASGDSVTSPMQGTIVKVAVEEGQEVAEGDVIVVLEAMKMEQPLKAHKAGTVTGLSASVGDSVTSGAVVCELKD
jgi:acetyl-CoA/propionyl-CoA carboxylase biotin carboxyl carrier protein